jgi:hypothetical protein
MEELTEDFLNLNIKKSDKKPPRKSKNKELLEKYEAKGKTIPKCINLGCNKKVAIRHWSAQGDPSLKTECCSCSLARKKEKEREGITFHKKKYCENKDGQLGFKCPMDPLRYAEFPSDIYHMDHLDSNHENNDPKNVKTFCGLCHTRKGKENDDFNSQKKSSRKEKSIKVKVKNNKKKSPKKKDAPEI